MGNHFDLSPYSFNLHTGRGLLSPPFHHASSSQTDCIMDNPMSAEVGSYFPDLSRYLHGGNGGVGGTWNEREFPPPGCHIEQCYAESCFFGCKGHSLHRKTQLASINPAIFTPKVYELERGDYSPSDEVSSANFIGPKQSEIRAGDYERWSELAPTFEPLPGVHPNALSHGLGYHSRHASVPPSPTQTVPQRQRRMSEPFNSIVDRHGVPGVTVRSPRSASSSVQFGGSAKTEPKPVLFKTELCRSWEEKGSCRYGNKCQFAHSLGELRPVPRHPKYKTQLCKTFLEIGSCNYGNRCCFLHATSLSESQVAKSVDAHLDIFS